MNENIEMQRILREIIKIILLTFCFLLTSCVKEEKEIDDKTEGLQPAEIIETQDENQTDDNNLYIVVLTEIRIRDNGSTSGEIVGHVYPGEYYEALDVKENEGYTWFKISDKQWVADNGSWLIRVENLNPKQLSDDEIKLFMEKYCGSWFAFEYPSFEEVFPGTIRYDWDPQYIAFFTDGYREEHHLDYKYDIAYDIAARAAYGPSYNILRIIQLGDDVYKISVQETDIGFGLLKYFDLSTFILYDDGLEEGRIQVFTDDKNSTDAYFYHETKVNMYRDYMDWLVENGYFVNPYKSWDDSIEHKIWPTGLDNVRVSLYEAKKIVEDAGLVFTTNIPKEEWDNPGKYHFFYIIDGKQVYSSSMSCKLGTEVFFCYY